MVASKQHFVALQQCQNQVTLQRNRSGVVSKFLLIILKEWRCFLVIRAHFLSFKNLVKIFIRFQSPSFENLLILTLLDNNRSAV